MEARVLIKSSGVWRRVDWYTGISISDYIFASSYMGATRFSENLVPDYFIMSWSLFFLKFGLVSWGREFKLRLNDTS